MRHGIAHDTPLPTSHLEIDLAALDANCRRWREFLADGCDICAVVKADAYGLGAVPIAKRLVSSGVNMLAVYSADQARELVNAAAAGGPNSATILILMPIEQLGRTDALYRPLMADRLHLTVHSLEQLEHVDALGQQYGKPVPVHVEIDTGMTRLGMPLHEAERIFEAIAARRYVRLAGVLSHAAAANNDPTYTQRQFAHFDTILARHRDVIGPDVAVHFAGTYAAMRNAGYHRRMVRLGLGLFGYGPENLEHADHAEPTLPDVQPILRWVSRIIHLRDVPPNVGVGYNLEYTTTRPTRLGVVPVGYGDGYPWSLRSGDQARAVVRVGQALHVAPLRGQVNMDQSIIDLTDLPADAATLGAEVEIIANDRAAPNALPRVAAGAESTCYEALCRLSPRLKRHYLTAQRPTAPPLAAAR